MLSAALIMLAALAVEPGLAESVAVEPRPEGLPVGAVAVVEQLPAPLGVITVAEFRRSRAQVAAQDAFSAPEAGDRDYRELAERALEQRLDLAWIQGEAAERGLTATERGISKELARVKRRNFESEAAYRRFLREARLTEAEVRERIEVQILSRRIQADVLEGVRGLKAAQEVLAEFVKDYNRRWRSRTICAVQYASDRCSNGA